VIEWTPRRRPAAAQDIFVTDRFRAIPSIEQFRQRQALQQLEDRYGRAAVIDALRAEAVVLRERLRTGDGPADIPGALERGVRTRLEEGSAPSLRPVINATGVIVHTNLGRAPLARVAIERIAQVAAGYGNLEYDLAAGRRGRRDVHATRLICRLTGAAAAAVVNNNAAATLIALAALAQGREAIISRGELVEIGGGFRVPEVMKQSGAILREVGTTNRTRVADYAAAISDRTALILRVHPSNFTMAGFTERPTLAELAALGARFNVPVIEDLGSGYLGGLDAVPALRHEPVVAHSIEQGAALVLFSGDKLLGGPQAGLIAGTEAAIARVRRHPLMRALRADKLTYAALEATLAEHAAGRAAETIPVSRMIALSAAEIAARTDTLHQLLAAAGVSNTVVDGVSTIGGGSVPGSELATRLVAIALPAERLEALLRTGEPPVIARIESGRLLLDLRTVDPADDSRLAQLVVQAASTLFP
jgi:L-seryl-tRNA(Ser) seleniumtransferase